ncbi:hypothetical protein JXJ21_12430 [candidate division KSB1 bacterium]|nr:hypothetical protein [candidate division KSB1 bacterium]
MQKATIHTIFSLILMVHIQTAILSAGQKLWRFANRLQIGAEFDSNMRESRYSPDAGYALKTLFHSKGSLIKNRWQSNFQFMGGYQAYPEFAEDNKLLNEVNASLGYQALSRIQVGAESNLKFKFFVNKPWDYATGSGSLWVKTFFPDGIVLRLNLGMNGLDYASYDFYDFEGQFMQLSLSKQMTASISMRLGFFYHETRYLRDAFAYQSGTLLVFSPDKQQTDYSTAGALHFQYCGKFLITLSYQLQNNISNSYGLGFLRHRWQFFYSQTILNAFLLRCSGSYQKKNYRDELTPFVGLELDTEREENSFLVADFSKTIFSGTDLLLRYAIYQNESPLRALYYDKKLLLLGLEYHF